MDSNFQQEFVNAQSSLLAFARQQEQLQAQNQMLTAEKKHRELTANALEEAPGAELYKNAGKIYFRMEKESIIDGMNKATEASDKELKLIQSTLQYVDKKVKESEDKVKDMLKIAQQNQQQ